MPSTLAFTALALVLVLFPALGLRAQQGPTAEGMIQGKVFIASLRGDVSVTAEGKPMVAPRLKAVEAEGVRLEVKGEGFATIALSNGTVVHLMNDTAAQIERFRQDPWERTKQVLEAEPSVSLATLNLERGTALIRSPTLRPLTDIILKTPLGESRIEGREVLVRVEESKVRLDVLDGTLYASGAGIEDDSRTIIRNQGVSIHLNRSGTRNFVYDRTLDPVATTVFDQMRDRLQYTRERTYFFCTRSKPHEIRVFPLVKASDLKRTAVNPHTIPRPK